MSSLDQSDARRQLAHLLGYIAETPDPTDFDGASESAYAVLYTLGLDSSAETRVGDILRNSWEAAAVESVAVALDEVLSAYGNCETETHNLKTAAWMQVRQSAAEAYSLLTTEVSDTD
jgi:hypothetical protein